MNALGVALDAVRNVLYIADNDRGVLAFNISRISSPKFAGECNPHSVCTADSTKGNCKVAVHGKYVYMVGDLMGIAVCDFTNLEKPKLVKTLQTPGK